MMLCAFLFALISILTQHVYGIKILSCKCGMSNEAISERIFGGEEVPKNRYPWMASIEVDGDSLCGGSLINDLYVLTAGHCITGIPETVYKIYLGVGDQILRTEPSYTAVKSIRPQNYTALISKVAEDIALLKLDRRVAFSKFARPICLPNPRSTYYNLVANVAGWGTHEKGNESPDLLEAKVRVMTDKFCSKSEIGRKYGPSMLCAYDVGKDACSGDSGGPLFYMRRWGIYEQIGIVSFGVECGTSTPGVYTKLTEFLPWIQKNTQDAAYCSV